MKLQYAPTAPSRGAPLAHFLAMCCRAASADIHRSRARPGGAAGRIGSSVSPTAPPTKKAAPDPGAAFDMSVAWALALAGFEPALRLVDDVYAALATHNAAITMPVFERTERVANLHGASSLFSWRQAAPGCVLAQACRCRVPRGMPRLA